MTKDQKIPGADTTSQWYQDDFPGSVMDANCGCFHTTEGMTWPGYSGGATAPNMTSKPDFARKRLVHRQHFPVDRSSRALKNLAGGVETNTLNVFQWELIGTCDPDIKRAWIKAGKKQDVDFIFWPEAPDWALRDIAKVAVWLESEHAIPAKTPIKGVWTAYPESHGPGGQRFTFAQWRALAGWCGHQHVPENVHGDPGALNAPRIFGFHVPLLKAPPPPVVPLPPRPPVTRRGNVNYARLVTAFKNLNDDTSNDTEQVQRALNAVYGLKLRTDGIIDAPTILAYKEHQRRFGAPVTGMVTKWSLGKLGFTVS